MTIPYSEDDVLFHYGVKGMKWGVRRDEAMLNRIGGLRQRVVGGTAQERKQLLKEHKRDWQNYKKSTTRAERKADAKKVWEEKVLYLAEEIKKDPLVAIAYGDTVYVGRYFADMTIDPRRAHVVGRWESRQEKANG